MAPLDQRLTVAGHKNNIAGTAFVDQVDLR